MAEISIEKMIYRSIDFIFMSRNEINDYLVKCFEFRSNFSKWHNFLLQLLNKILTKQMKNRI